MRKRISPQRGERNLAGGERSEPPVEEHNDCTPAGVAGSPRAAAGARSFIDYSGGSLRSPPAKFPAPLAGRPESGCGHDVTNKETRRLCGEVFGCGRRPPPPLCESVFICVFHLG